MRTWLLLATLCAFAFPSAVVSDSRAKIERAAKQHGWAVVACYQRAGKNPGKYAVCARLSALRRFAPDFATANYDELIDLLDRLAQSKTLSDQMSDSDVMSNLLDKQIAVRCIRGKAAVSLLPFVAGQKIFDRLPASTALLHCNRG